MVKAGCGVAMLVLGVILTIWIAYNLLFEQQREFTLAIGGLLFLCGLFFVGGKWLHEGWPDVERKFRPKKRKKKKRSRPAVEDDE